MSESFFRGGQQTNFNYAKWKAVIEYVSLYATPYQASAWTAFFAKLHGRRGVLIGDQDVKSSF